ncbi:hypothetical protein SAMN05421796_1144 [Chryseobacterium piscicola]|uniref:Uncharacterized protein n=1 Tax=Chryseobacterium piscicola TaxID=551459 RepID=A0A1N7PFL1_9FLAO|nr:hypothetical protein [Chryseobacterium piscicola]PQA92084.1 hypothetical protein B0A70_11700 [Chryseobacterium piscicola]SIT09382.1 hypothetical protein SAMN05421796_1144 [Chryseobacterium piscicola]
MKANLFKNFKTLREKEEEKKLATDEKVDNVSVAETVSENLKSDKKPDTTNLNDEKSSEGKADSITEISDLKPVEKKRPVKKEILEARAALQESNRAKPEAYSKKINIDQGKRTFTVFLKPDSLEFIKDLVFYKATAERQIFYNQSEAIIESLELIMPAYKSISPRPDFIREQEKTKKGGRKRNSDEVYDATTTIYIPGQYFDFIKDVTYNKVVEGNLYFKDWDLLESSITKLKQKYGDNIQPRPDYIREDEKLRGRRSKADS